MLIVSLYKVLGVFKKIFKFSNENFRGISVNPYGKCERLCPDIVYVPTRQNQNICLLLNKPLLILYKLKTCS